MSSFPPDGLSVRRATVEDAPAVNELITAADVAVQGWSESSESELLGWWRMMDLDQDSWVLHENGAIAAYAAGFLHGETFELDGYVHPERQGRGMGAWLVARAEERARELSLPRLYTFSLAADERAHRLFHQFGLRELRRYYRMLIELDAPPEPAQLPDGLRFDTFKVEDAREFHDAVGDAFTDEWNFVHTPFEEWWQLRVEAPDFDPTLWFVVRDGNEMAAVARCEPDRSGAGFVGLIGVRKPWRRRGVGLVLLQHVFAEFYRRGQPRIALGVDAQNPTGATRLYERAGMRVAYEAVTHGKELT